MINLKKKVGLLTLPLSDNYGGMLQAIALYGFLNESGYDVVFFRNEFVRKKRSAWFWNVIERLPFHNFRGTRHVYLKKVFHENFLKKHLPKRTESLRSIDEFKRLAKSEKFDAIVVGSDQVWRWDYILDEYHRYFLSFIEGKKTRKISYAASFGKSHWQIPEKKNEISELLTDFHAISVRESNGVEICGELGIDNCEQVLDPTLLVDKSFYNKLITKEKQHTGNKILLTYVLDEQGNKGELIKQVYAKLGESYILKSLGLKSNVAVPEWVSAFHNADFVITDSFHGMIFSILFNKQFIVIGNRNRGFSRFTSLLEQLGIADRLIEENDLTLDSAQHLVINEIDYLGINSKLHELRDLSSSFLINALNA